MNTNTNIFGLTKKVEYEYEYILFEEKGQIQIWIKLGWQKRANTNMITNILTGVCKYQYNYEYLSCTDIRTITNSNISNLFYTFLST